MEFIFFAGGVVVGIAIIIFISRHNKICGFIDIDHNNELCQVHTTSEDLTNRKTKKAVFIINHDAKISREEQVL